MKYPAYPEYRDSGSTWLGEIPSHWVTQPLKYNSYMKGRIGWQNLRSEEFTDTGPFLVTGMHFRDGTVDWDACYHITDERYLMAPEIQLKALDVLMTKDGSIGKVAYVDALPGPASLNSHLLVIRPLRGTYVPRFIFHLLDSPVFQRYVGIVQTGTTFFGITQESVACFPALLPPLPEQIAIADFLDAETAKIDTLVEKKRELVEKLRERRTALISRTVTRGLPPGAARAAGLSPSPPLKPSGIEWLGDIPEHWVASKIKFQARTVSKGTTPSTIGKELVDGGIRFIKAENIQDGCVVEKPEFFIDPETDRLLARSRLKQGDVLIVIAGATTGKTAVLQADLLPANTNQAVCFIRLVRSQYASMLSGWMQTRFVQDRIWTSAVQSAQPNLAMQDVRGFPCLVPPPLEQQAIIDYLDQETTKIDRMAEKIEEAVQKLQEYRTALITAAVTGKIDVRGFKP